MNVVDAAIAAPVIPQKGIMTAVAASKTTPMIIVFVMTSREWPDMSRTVLADPVALLKICPNARSISAVVPAENFGPKTARISLAKRAKQQKIGSDTVTERRETA